MPYPLSYNSEHKQDSSEYRSMQAARDFHSMLDLGSKADLKAAQEWLGEHAKDMGQPASSRGLAKSILVVVRRQFKEFS